MLAAFGLDRLEAALIHGRAPKNTAAAHLTSAGARETTDGLEQRLRQRRITIEAAMRGADAERLPTRSQSLPRTNTEFPATRYANRV